MREYREKRKAKFAQLIREEGYLEGTVLHFDNEKGVGLVMGDDGLKYVAHYKSMLGRVYKILAKSQRVHFRPGVYQDNRVTDRLSTMH